MAKDYQKFIFDLDYTLLIPDWSKEDDYLRKKIPIEEQEAFFREKQRILNQYEIEYPRYNFKTLSDYFREAGFTITEDVISGWMIHNGKTIKDEVATGALELLEYLKANHKDIVLLTSWFSGTQIPRLKRTGLYPYFGKNIVAGENAMKPDLESFELAIGKTPKEKCLMIGDSLKSDKKGADNAGIDCYIVSKEHTLKDLLDALQSEKEDASQYVKK